MTLILLLAKFLVVSLRGLLLLHKIYSQVVSRHSLDGGGGGEVLCSGVALIGPSAGSLAR